MSQMGDPLYRKSIYDHLEKESEEESNEFNRQN